jgi:hypothetical protein
MQRLGGSMTLYFNEKHREKGSIFQGAFKSRTVDDDIYLQYVHTYIVVKNTLENYPGGLKKALNEFDKAWRWIGEGYPFTSFLTASAGIESPIIDMEMLHDLGLARKDFKHFAQDMLMTHVNVQGDIGNDFATFHLEDW